MMVSACFSACDCLLPWNGARKSQGVGGGRRASVMAYATVIEAVMPVWLQLWDFLHQVDSVRVAMLLGPGIQVVAQCVSGHSYISTSKTCCRP